ncbi:MAG: hypothetical protein AB8B61_09210 [Cyclobacteriaceae bacterium]
MLTKKGKKIVERHITIEEVTIRIGWVKKKASELMPSFLDNFLECFFEVYPELETEHRTALRIGFTGSYYLFITPRAIENDLVGKIEYVLSDLIKKA